MIQTATHKNIGTRLQGRCAQTTRLKEKGIMICKARSCSRATQSFQQCDNRQQACLMREAGSIPLVLLSPSTVLWRACLSSLQAIHLSFQSAWTRVASSRGSFRPIGAKDERSVRI